MRVGSACLRGAKMTRELLNNRRRALPRGSTLIIAVLALMGSLALSEPQHRSHNAMEAEARADEQTLAAVLNQFRLDCNRYPTTKEGLIALISAPRGLEHAWRGPYLAKHRVPLDPWKHAYLFQSGTSSTGREWFSITCLGADGKAGGVGDAADIRYRQ